MKRLAGLALLVVSACASPATEEDATSGTESALTPGWAVIGNGVAYKATGAGDGVFIGYAGYSVRLDDSAPWVDALAESRLRALGVGHLYAVKGPSDPGYAAREIANSRLAAHLGSGPGEAAPFVLVAAHSSGTYVAHELFGQVDATIADKIVYANLDGGTRGLVASALKRVVYVWAEDPGLRNGRSANADGMEAQGTHGLRLAVPGSGCHSGAKWCLHDLLITTRPHDPDRFDLHRDYTDFAGRPVQIGWIRAVEADLTR
jgi:hypothetical protein